MGLKRDIKDVNEFKISDMARSVLATITFQNYIDNINNPLGYLQSGQGRIQDPALFADVAVSFCVHAAVDWFCAILINSFHKNSERKVTLNRFFFLSGRSCILWHKNCKNLRKGDYRCPRK